MRRCAARGDYDINRKASEFACGGSELVGLPLRRSIFNNDIPAIYVAKLESLPEVVPDRRSVDDAYARSRPLLRACRERPCGRRMR